VLQAAADPSKAKVLKKTGGMNKNILQSELLMFLSSVPQVERLLAAELEEIVEDAMIEKLDVGNYEEFWWRPTVAVHWDAGRLEPVMTRQLPHRYGHLAIDEENQLYAVGSKDRADLLDTGTLQVVKKIPFEHPDDAALNTSIFMKGNTLIIGIEKRSLLFRDMKADKFLENAIELPTPIFTHCFD